MTRFALAALAAVTLGAGAAQADHLSITVPGASFKGDTITFPAVMTDKPGWLVIHAVEDGQPVIPASIGHTMIPAGTSTDVTVQLDQRVMKGSDYLVMLHYETNGNGAYDFGPGNTADDLPAMKADGTPYMIQFKTQM